MLEMADQEASAEFGEDLFVAALAVVREPGNLRVVHDGTNGIYVDNKLRPRDQVRSPGAGEIGTILAEKKSSGNKLFAIAGDASKAHRRVKIKREDWGFQACRIHPGKVWVNTVGTYDTVLAA